MNASELIIILSTRKEQSVSYCAEQNSLLSLGHKTSSHGTKELSSITLQFTLN